MNSITSPLRNPLNDLVKFRNTVDLFRQAHGPQMLEGLVSKGYATIVDGRFVEITLQGTKALLDAEGVVQETKA